MSNSPVAFVRTEAIAPQPAPLSEAGVIAWMRHNFFNGIFGTLLTVVSAYLLYASIPPLVNFFITNAAWNGDNREACLAAPHGACYPYLKARFWQFVYGFYPEPERWRANVTFFAFAILMAGLMIPKVPFKKLNALLFFVGIPILGYVLLSGSTTLGMPIVSTGQWGGMLVTFVVASIGIVVSLPIGIVLALGRRSDLPLVRLFSVVFIEFWRGVPLITVLFMAKTMIPLFLPDEWSPDQLLRALIGVTLFSSAYLAEVVRGGLQAIPKGQFEGAMSVGLSYWQMMNLIILPQALKLVIPGIVNTFIALFKDTSLLLIIGVFDFLLQVSVSLRDPNWATPTTMYTGFGFAMVFYFFCCFGMSRYSMYMERRLSAGQRH